MRHHHAILPTALVCAAIACTDADPMGLVDGALEVRVGAAGLLISNRSAVHPIGVVPIEESLAAVVDLAPCETWETIPPATTSAVPFEEIHGWSEATEGVIVHWCLQAGPADGGSVRVELSWPAPTPANINVPTVR